MASSAAKVIWGENSDNNNNNTTTTDTTTNPTTDTTTTNNTTTTTKMTNETQGQEPVSGKLGDTSKGEPFDAGNIGSLPPSLASPERSCFILSFVCLSRTCTDLLY